MKKSTAIFLTGLILGVAICGVGAALRFRWLTGHLSGIQLAGQVNVLQEIRSGRGDELADRIEQSLPAYVEQLDQAFPSTSGARMALGMVSRYYENAAVPAPAEIRDILEELDSARSQ